MTLIRSHLQDKHLTCPPHPNILDESIPFHWIKGTDQSKSLVSEGGARLWVRSGPYLGPAWPWWALDWPSCRGLRPILNSTASSVPLGRSTVLSTYIYIWVSGWWDWDIRMRTWNGGLVFFTCYFTWTETTCFWMKRKKSLSFTKLYFAGISPVFSDLKSF